MQVDDRLKVKDWVLEESGTLSPEGIYTCASDLFQVGVMLRKHNSLPHTGRELVAELTGKHLTAANALQHQYFS